MSRSNSDSIQKAKLRAAISLSKRVDGVELRQK